MKARGQSVAICFFLVAGGFTVTKPDSLGAGAAPSKRQFISNGQKEPDRLLDQDWRGTAPIRAHEFYDE